jgi:hypothetical protein
MDRDPARRELSSLLLQLFHGLLVKQGRALRPVAILIQEGGPRAVSFFLANARRNKGANFERWAHHVELRHLRTRKRIVLHKQTNI